VAVSFIGGGNQNAQRKPPTCRKSLTNFITKYFFQFDTKKKQFKEYDKNLKSIGKKVKKRGI
jgi:hypothetical protein